MRVVMLFESTDTLDHRSTTESMLADTLFSAAIRLRRGESLEHLVSRPPTDMSKTMVTTITVMEEWPDLKWTDDRIDRLLDELDAADGTT